MPRNLTRDVSKAGSDQRNPVKPGRHRAAARIGLSKTSAEGQSEVLLNMHMQVAPRSSCKMPAQQAWSSMLDEREFT